MRVAVVTVGDELLAGDITNTNAAWLGRELTECGVDVERMLTIPDDVDVIASTVADLSGAFDAVLVTGGLGPTHDDCTMEGVADAFGVSLTDNSEAVTWLREHKDYQYEKLTEGTAHLPEGARHLPNEVGVAPGAVVENVYVFPGVPEEMHAMFERVADEFSGTEQHVEFVYTSEPESALIDRFEEVRDRFEVTVGSYPGDGVRIKLRGPDQSVVTAAADWLRENVAEADYR